MANTFAPFGFSQAYQLTGAPTYQQSVKRIASANATKIYKGDPVVQLNTGYIAQASAGTTQIAGIFLGCKYNSISQMKPVWSAYWPGADANGDVEAYVIDDPSTVFRVQSGNGGPVTFASVGNNVNFAVGTGSATAGGMSGAYADFATLNTTSTLPFKIVGLVYDPPGSNGTDTASAYNWLYVVFNWQDYKSTTGI